MEEEKKRTEIEEKGKIEISLDLKNQAEDTSKNSESINKILNEEKSGLDKDRLGSEKKSNEDKLALLLEEFNKDKPKYILLEKTKSLYTILHPYLELFPKSEKFTLRQRIEEAILDSIKLLILQNFKTDDFERKKFMLDFLANINLLEILLQQSIIFKYLSFGGYQKILVLVREISSIAHARYKNLSSNSMEKEEKNENL